jgi:hypothetical protein
MNVESKKCPLEQFAFDVYLTLSSMYSGYTLEKLKDDFRFIGECHLGFRLNCFLCWIFYLGNIIAGIKIFWPTVIH